MKKNFQKIEQEEKEPIEPKHLQDLADEIHEWEDQMPKDRRKVGEIKAWTAKLNALMTEYNVRKGEVHFKIIK